jgi:hypothetical protein
MKIPAKVMHWDDERSIGNSLIITLKRGWAFGANNTRYAEHVEGFDTVKEARAAIKEAKQCSCFDCVTPSESLMATLVTL